MRRVLAGAVILGCLGLASAQAAERPLAVATFSILADLVQRVGGEHVEVRALVERDEDAHVFEPGPKESAELSAASLLVANGAGFEPWLERLEAASGFKGTVVMATTGARLLAGEEHHEEAEGADDDRDHGVADPHAFQDLENAEVYVSNIVQGLSAVDPAHAPAFKANGDALIAEMGKLDTELKAAFAAIPEARRRILTSHDAFQYFGNAYGVDFIAVQGVSTEAEPSAQDLAEIVRQAREGQVAAIFLENMADPRLAETVAQESGVRIGGALYADALSPESGPAPDYLTMMRYNAAQLLDAMR